MSPLQEHSASQLHLRLQAHCHKLRRVHLLLKAEVLPLVPHYHSFLGVYEWHPISFKQPVAILLWGVDNLMNTETHPTPVTVLSMRRAAGCWPFCHLAGLPGATQSAG